MKEYIESVFGEEVIKKVCTELAKRAEYENGKLKNKIQLIKWVKENMGVATLKDAYTLVNYWQWYGEIKMMQDSAHDWPHEIRLACRGASAETYKYISIAIPNVNHHPELVQKCPNGFMGLRVDLPKLWNEFDRKNLVDVCEELSIEIL